MASSERAAHQTRVVVEAEDVDDAVRLARDVLGPDEPASFEGDGDARVVILDAGRAELELANPTQVDMLDEIDMGRRISPNIRLAVASSTTPPGPPTASSPTAPDRSRRRGDRRTVVRARLLGGSSRSSPSSGPDPNEPRGTASASIAVATPNRQEIVPGPRRAPGPRRRPPRSHPDRFCSELSILDTRTRHGDVGDGRRPHERGSS